MSRQEEVGPGRGPGAKSKRCIRVTGDSTVLTVLVLYGSESSSNDIPSSTILDTDKLKLWNIS